MDTVMDAAFKAMLERVDFLVSLDGTSFFDVDPGSALGLDDAALHPLSASTTAAASLSSSFDHLGTFRGLRDETAAPGAVLFASIRASLDSAASTIWLLEPEDERERRTRLLGDAWGDIRDADRLLTALGAAGELTRRGESDWAAAHERALGAAEPAAAQLPVPLSRRVDLAATVVGDFTRVPGAAAVIRTAWQGLAGLGRGRYAAYGLPGGEPGAHDADASAGAMLAGLLSMALDVAETAASLFHVRTVAHTAEPAE